MKDSAPPSAPAFLPAIRDPGLARPRVSTAALVVAVVAWAASAAGCATPRPMVEPVFAARTYTPARIALLPPAVTMVLDEYGDNDPRQSWQLGQAVTQQTVGLIAQELRRLGYDVSLQARWDGIFDGSGQLIVPSNELGWLANSIVQFANSEAGGGGGEMQSPAFVAPELARKVGWATQSDALLYLNMKGVSVTPGKRSAQIIGSVFIVVVIAAIIALTIAQSRGGGGGESRGARGRGGGAQPGAGSSAVAGGAGGAMGVAPGAGARPTSAAVAPPVGRGNYGGGRGGGRTYRSGPRVSSGVHVGVGVMVPFDGGDSGPGPGAGPGPPGVGPAVHEDELYAGDQVEVSFTLVAAQDGRVLWHIRDSVDIDAAKPPELQRFVQRYLGLLPASLAPSAAPGAGPASPSGSIAR